MKSILASAYASHTPDKLDTDSGTSTVNIDREEYELNNKILLADSICPKLNLLIAVSNRFSSPNIPTPKISVNKNKVNIKLCHAKYYSFLIKRNKTGKTDTIYDGPWKETITDAPIDGQYTYSVTPYFKDGLKIYYGSEIMLPTVKIGESGYIQDKLPDIAHKNWYD